MLVDTDVTEFYYTDEKTFGDAQSSALERVYFDNQTNTLAVRWRNSNVFYVYAGVEEEGYKEIAEASSPGNAASRVLSLVTSNNGFQPDRLNEDVLRFVGRPREDVDWGGTANYEVLMSVNGNVRLKVEATDMRHAVERVQTEVADQMFENSEIEILKVERVFE